MVHLCKRNICRIWNTIDKSDFEAFSRPFKIAKISIKKIFKKSVYEHNEKQLTEKLSLNNDSSKLFLYSKLKSDIKVIVHQFWVKKNIPENSFWKWWYLY